MSLLKNNFVNLLIFAFAFRVVFAFLYWHPDVTNHIDWGIRLFEYTPSGFYAPEANVWSFTWPNQPPGTIYMFGFIKIIFDIIFGILLFVNEKIAIFPSIIVSFSELNLYPALLQMPAILADFGIAYLIYKITKSKLASLIFLLNPVIWYNSSVWGQYDSVINFLFLLSIFFAFKKKLFFSLLAIAISLYIKISLIILLPIYAFYLMKQFKFANILAKSVLVLIIILIINLPFSGSNNPVVWLYEVYTQKVLSEQLHVITANAFNFWGMLTGVDWKSNSDIVWGLSYSTWGYLLFTIFSLPIYFKAFRAKKINIILLCLGLVYFVAWMFLTNMHERYLYPFFVFALPALVLMKKSLKTYLALSILSLINMYFLWFTPLILVFKNILEYQNNLLPRILSGVFLILFFKVYKDFLRKTAQNKL